MKLLFSHQNFPGQYKHLAPAFAADPGNEVVAIRAEPGAAKLEHLPKNIRQLTYALPRGAAAETHHYIRGFENAVRRGQQVARTAMELRRTGFVPDIICAHPGWGEAIYLKDIFPDAKLLGYFEFYYRAHGSDVGFDPEYPSVLDDIFRVRTKNATNLLSLEAADWGFSPTHWQRAQFPVDYRKRISVIHDGVDTDVIRPNPSIGMKLTGGQELRAGDEIVTFVSRNLEPYRGFHIFMRAAAEICRRRPNCRILIVGGDEVSYGRNLPDGKLYREALLAELGNRLDPARVHFLGKIPYGHFLSLLQISAAHVYLTYPFVLSWSMLEAMATGCLVIGSATPPVQEVIEDGVNGLLVDFFSPTAIADRVDQVLEHPNRLQELRARARQTVIDRYDLRRHCLPAHIRLIQDLVAGRTPRGVATPPPEPGPEIPMAKPLSP